MFGIINHFLRSYLSSNQIKTVLKAEISYLIPNNYYSNYRTSLSSLKKHTILEKRKKNKDIVIIRPDKGNGKVVMDKVLYDRPMYALLSDKNKSKKLS